MEEKDTKQENQLVIYQEEKILENQVNKEAIDISKEIAKVNNKDELDNLYAKFKINDTKKNIFRVNKLNNLLDKVTDEAIARFENRPGEMSNKEVLDYMNIVQNQIERSKDTINSIKDINNLQVNNTVNVSINDNKPTLDRESKEKIIDFVKNVLMSTSQNDIIDVSTEENTDNEK